MGHQLCRRSQCAAVSAPYMPITESRPIHTFLEMRLCVVGKGGLEGLWFVGCVEFSNFEIKSAQFSGESSGYGEARTVVGRSTSPDESTCFCHVVLTSVSLLGHRLSCRAVVFLNSATEMCSGLIPMFLDNLHLFGLMERARVAFCSRTTMS